MQHRNSLFFNVFLSLFILSACGEKQAEKPESGDSSASSVTISNESTTDSNKAATKPKVDRGASLYKRCRTCHTLNKDGAHKSGPNLYGIFGATAGTKDGFRYSSAMKSSAIVWNDETLGAYIQNPSKFMPGNSMSFAGIRKDEDVKILLEYLKSKTGEN